MKLCGIVALLLLASGCATTRVVNLDTGQGTPIVYQPVDTDPIELDEAGFKRAVAQLVLDMNLNVMKEESEQDTRLSLLASARGGADCAQGCTMAWTYARMGQQQGNPRASLNRLAGKLTLALTEPRTMALSLVMPALSHAMRTWEAPARGAGLNGAALRAAPDPDAAAAQASWRSTMRPLPRRDKP